MATTKYWDPVLDQWVYSSLPASLPEGPPTGAVNAYAGTTAPSGWLLCHGQAVSRTTYAALFALVGTTFGAGDGSTTFNLPDLRGRFPLGLDNLGGSSANRVVNAQADLLGGSAGAETHTLTEAEMPSHAHDVSAMHSQSAGTGNVLDAGFGNGVSVTRSTQSKGGGGAHNNMPPYLALGYIIKT